MLRSDTPRVRDTVWVSGLLDAAFRHNELRKAHACNG